MKTKHILTAMALPALFAACTAEEIVNEGVATLQERATVENVTVKIGEGAESRYAVEGASSLKFNFETGDKFGAALIDQYDYNNPTKPELWDVIPSLAGNIPFTYNATAAEWKAPEDLPLGIGHYLFVYPYNRADVNRAAVSYELPAVQKLYTKENGEIDLNAAIEAGNKSFYATVLTEADEELEITLKNLYTYPKFVINFDNGEKVTTVSKVVLAKEGGFEVKGGFNHEVVADLFANKVAAFLNEDEVTDWNLVQTADVLTANENYAAIESSDYLVAELPLNAEVEEVTNNKSIEVRFMMPGFLMDKNLSALEDYTMYVYTNNGAYSFNLGEEDAIAWKSTTKVSSKQKAFARGAANTITIDKEVVKKDKNAPYIVTSVEDWNDLVKLYGAEENFTTKEDGAIQIAVVGGSLVLDETAKMPTKAQFDVETITVAGEVELCNIIADEVIVKKNAVLTTCTSLQATNIVNNGEVVVAAAYNAKGKAIACENITSIVNKGTLNVEEDAIATLNVTNAKGAIFNNEGTLTLEEGSNNGTINNAGTINMYDFENEAYEYKNDKVVNKPTINNEGKIVVKGDVDNYGDVINEGSLSCKNQNGTFNNYEYLDAKADGLTYITLNEGEVEVYAPFQADLEIESQNGTVTYHTAKASEAFKTTTATSMVNKLYVSDDYTISAGNIATLIVEGDATISLTKNAAGAFLSTVNKLEVIEGTTILGSDFELNGIEVKEDAMVKVPASVALTIKTSDYENDGEIEVAGEFYAYAIESDNGGLVTESGANSYIAWKENADADNAYKTKIQMLAEAVAEYMNDATCAYQTSGHKLQLAAFNKHLADVQTAAQHKNTFKKADAYTVKYGVTSVNAVDFEKAYKKVASDNKKALIETLEKATFTPDATLYDKKAGVKATGETYGSAYEALKEAIVKGVQGNVTVKSIAYAATALTTDEIDAILAKAAPYAYIWEGCEFDALVTVWVKYNGMTKLDSDFEKAVANNKVDIATLKEFMLAVKSGDSATSKEIQGLISEWTILELNNMKYIDAQVKAAARGAWVSINGGTPNF